jgi:hypothetical protein
VTGRHRSGPALFPPGLDGRPASFRGRRVARYAKPVLALAGGSAALVCCGGVLGLELPRANAVAHEFRAAVPCAVDGSGTDCLSTARFTVRDVRIRHGKTAQYDADLTGPPPGDVRVEFEDEQPLLRRLHPGDTVHGTLWRGRIVTVTSSDGRIRQITVADPTRGPADAITFATILGISGGVATAIGLILLIRLLTAEPAA